MHLGEFKREVEYLDVDAPVEPAIEYAVEPLRQGDVFDAPLPQGLQENIEKINAKLSVAVKVR
jgi:hypothetical protein